MRRIAIGTFENTYVNTVNKVAYASNTVRTTTPIPRTPDKPTPIPTPKPKDPDKPETPKEPKVPSPKVEDPSAPIPVSVGKELTTLPKTGTNDSSYMPLFFNPLQLTKSLKKRKLSSSFLFNFQSLVAFVFFSFQLTKS